MDFSESDGRPERKLRGINDTEPKAASKKSKPEPLPHFDGPGGMPVWPTDGFFDEERLGRLLTAPEIVYNHKLEESLRRQKRLESYAVPYGPFGGGLWD